MGPMGPSTSHPAWRRRWPARPAERDPLARHAPVQRHHPRRRRLPGQCGGKRRSPDDYRRRRRVPGLAVGAGRRRRRPRRCSSCWWRRWGRPWSTWCPIDVLRAVIGTLLLVFGLQWLRKAVLRAVGLKAKHDEDAIFRQHVESLCRRPEAPAAGGRAARPERDATGFVVAFKGTFLEGLEVAIIVLGLGGGDHQLGLASAAAGAAILVVAGVGVVVARQLAGVPENAMKIVVGLMLVSFGTFWAGEGLGVRWPGSDLAIPGAGGRLCRGDLGARPAVRPRRRGASAPSRPMPKS